MLHSQYNTLPSSRHAQDETTCLFYKLCFCFSCCNLHAARRCATLHASCCMKQKKRRMMTHAHIHLKCQYFHIDCTRCIHVLHLYVHLHASHAVLTSKCFAAAPALAATSSTAKKLGIGIGVPIGTLLLSLGVCLVFYIYSRHARRQKASSGLFKGYSKGSRSKSVAVQACAHCSLLFTLCLGRLLDDFGHLSLHCTPFLNFF